MLRKDEHRAKVVSRDYMILDLLHRGMIIIGKPKVFEKLYSHTLAIEVPN